MQDQQRWAIIGDSRMVVDTEDLEKEPLSQLANNGQDVEQLEDLLDHELLRDEDESDSHQSEDLPSLILTRRRLIPLKMQSKRIMKRRQEAPIKIRERRARSEEANASSHLG